MDTGNANQGIITPPPGGFDSSVDIFEMIEQNEAKQNQEIAQQSTEIQPNKPEPKEPAKATNEQEKPIEQEINLLGEVDEPVTPQTPVKQPKAKLEASALATLNYFKKTGYFQPEDDLEGYTEEDAQSVLSDVFETAIEQKFASKLKDLPESVKNLNRYVLAGGNPADFLESLKQAKYTPEIPVDLSSEEVQEDIIRATLRGHYDADFIEDQIETLKEKGKLEIRAKESYSKIIEAEKAKQEELIRQQEEARFYEQEQLKEAKRKMYQFVQENQAIGEISLSREDKKSLPSYINDKVVQMSDGSAITQFQRDLLYELHKNDKALMQLALLVKNRNKDGTFNFTSIFKDAEKKVTSNLKNNLRNIEGGRSFPDYRDKPLSEYF